MKKHFYLLLLAILLFSNCSIPTRFASPNVSLPAGMSGGDIGFAYVSSLDTSNFSIPTISFGGYYQKTDDLAFKFGLINLISPYLGFEYRLATLNKITLKSGADFGVLDGALVIPLKTDFAISENVNYEFSLRFASILYKKDYTEIYKEYLLYTVEKSIYSPWYFGGDTGFNMRIFDETHLGIRVGLYWHKDQLNGGTNKVWLFGVNTLLGRERTPRSGFRYRLF